MNDATPSEDSKSNQADTTQTSVTASSVTDAVGRSVDGHRVLLVDDQPMIGEAVRRLLADQADITFAFCKDAAKALSTAEEFQPTVILQDLVMPDIDGLDLVIFSDGLGAEIFERGNVMPIVSMSENYGAGFRLDADGKQLI